MSVALIWPAVGWAQAGAVPKVGRPAPPLALRAVLNAPPGTPSAAHLDWDSLKGHAVVLEFWATTCGPCIASMPHLNELACEFEREPVRFISITSESERTVSAFLRNHTLSGWIGLDSAEATFAAYGVRAMPTTVLVGPDGVVVGYMSPEDLTAESLREVVAGRRPRLPDGMNMHVLRAGSDPDDKGGQAAPLAQLVIRPCDSPISLLSRKPGAITAQGFTLGALVDLAWPGHAHDRIIVPESMGTTRYTLIASIPHADEAQMQQALRTLVIGTFDVTVKEEVRDVEAVVLTLPNGVGRGVKQRTDRRASVSVGDGYYGFTDQPLRTLAMLVGAEFKKPVIDETGLGDTPCDFECRWDAADRDGKLKAMVAASGVVGRFDRRTLSVLTVEPRPAALATPGRD